MATRSKPRSMVKNNEGTVRKEGGGGDYIGAEQEQSKECRNVRDKEKNENGSRGGGSGKGEIGMCKLSRVEKKEKYTQNK